MSVAPHDPAGPPAPPGPINPPGPVNPPARPGPSLVVEALVALLAAIVVAGLGAPLGLLWAAVAPNVELVQTQYGVYPVDGQPEGYVADEGWFVGLAVLAGFVLAIVAWFGLRRYRGPLMLAALVVGSVGGAVLAAWLGSRIGLAEFERLVRDAPVGTRILRPVRLRTGEAFLWLGFVPVVQGALLVQPIAAGVLYTAFAGFHYSPSLRAEPEPAVPMGYPGWPGPVQPMPLVPPVDGVSSGWPAPPDHSVAPAPPAPSATTPPPDAAGPARP